MMRSILRLVRPLPLLAMTAFLWFAWKAGNDMPFKELALGDPTMSLCPEGSFRPEVIACFYTRESLSSRLDIPDPAQFLRAKGQPYQGPSGSGIADFFGGGTSGKPYQPSSGGFSPFGGGGGRPYQGG